MLAKGIKIHVEGLVKPKTRWKLFWTLEAVSQPNFSVSSMPSAKSATRASLQNPTQWSIYTSCSDNK